MIRIMLRSKCVRVLVAGVWVLPVEPVKAQETASLRSKILYVQRDAKVDVLWAASADGSKRRIVGRFKKSTLSALASVSSISRRLYLVEHLWSDVSRREVGIVLVSYRLDGSGRQVLKQWHNTKSTTYDISRPLLSPNGKLLSYSLTRFEDMDFESIDSECSEVHTISTDGSSDQVVVRRAKPLLARRASAWSRDGRQLLLSESRAVFRSADAKPEPDWLVCDASNGKVMSSSSGLLPADLARYDIPLVSRDGAWAIVPGPSDTKSERTGPPQRRNLHTGASFPLAIPVRVGPFETFWSNDGQMFALWWVRTGPTFEESVQGQRDQPGPRTGIDIFTRGGKRLRTLATNAELVAWLP